MDWCCEHEHEFWWIIPLIFAVLMLLCMFRMFRRGRGFCGGFFEGWRTERDRIDRLEEDMKTLKSKMEKN